jgi:hypothetical protein
MVGRSDPTSIVLSKLSAMARHFTTRNQMKALLLMELKGFEAQATSLAQRMAAIGLTADKVRSATRVMINNAIQDVSAAISVKDVSEIGGDTWMIEMTDATVAVEWGVHFLKILEQKVLSGLFYIKPVMSLVIGELKLQNGRFMDSESIAGYRVADKGEPFFFYAVGEAAKIVANMKHLPTQETEIGRIISWQQRTIPTLHNERRIEFSFAHLLLDNEVLYFRTHGDVIAFLQDQQIRSREIKVYGGPAPLRFPIYSEYNRSIELFLKTTNVRCSVLNYLSEDSPQDAADWLFMCRRLQEQYPNKFSHAAYLLPPNAIKPVAYHVYDDVTVIMLRSFDEFAQSHSVSGSIVVRGVEIAKRFREDFLESFRSVGRFDSSKYDSLIGALKQRGADLDVARTRANAAIANSVPE